MLNINLYQLIGIIYCQVLNCCLLFLEFVLNAQFMFLSFCPQFCSTMSQILFQKLSKKYYNFICEKRLESSKPCTENKGKKHSHLNENWNLFQTINISQKMFESCFCPNSWVVFCVFFFRYTIIIVKYWIFKTDQLITKSICRKYLAVGVYTFII